MKWMIGSPKDPQRNKWQGASTSEISPPGPSWFEGFNTGETENFDIFLQAMDDDL